ncbi:R8 protein [Oleoguttula sp. CCFEE 5521]
MFYSHEVLTSRKYGVATVWLVATLGSKSGLKRVSRKAILDVDVGKTCDTIITPEAPMALRLQSNLLYGVTRVYAQQCGYVLTDAETAKNNMRAMLKVMRTSQLDAEGGNMARADQLVLQDDPNFLPELDLLSLNFDAHMAGMRESQRSASTLSPRSSQLTTAPFEDTGGILIPPQSASSFAGGPVGGGGAFSVLGDSGAGSRIASGAFQHEPEGLLEDDLGVVIDEEGNVTMVEDLPARQSMAPVGCVDRTSVLSEGGSVGLRPQQRTPVQGEGQLWQPDDDGYMPILEDNDAVMADDNDSTVQQEGSVHHSTTSETAEAPARRRVKVRILSLDNTTELHGQDLNRWQQEYMQNMIGSRQHKQATRLTAIAKQNAEHWVLGSGLRHFAESAESDRNPLSMFSGLQLLEAMTGKKLTPGGEKRPREDDAREDRRRVRSRGEPSSDELGRGIQHDDDGYMPVIHDYEIEQGRDQPTPLDDRNMSSVFPWNQSAGSQRPTGLFGVNATSSIGGMPPGPISRRGSRLTTASPLLGRGEVAGGEDVLLPDSNPDIDFTGLDDFELFGPAADVDTQTAAQSQWVRSALDGESANFLTFVQAGIDELDEKREELAPDEGEDESMMGSVDFDHLLPPEKNTYIVAAQALLHVLTLGTKNAITVKQDEAYGSISLRVVEAY